jgi:hypothetical protein
MITIMIYIEEENPAEYRLTNVITKTLWEFAEWYRAKVTECSVNRWYDKSSGSFEMYMNNGIKYVIEENK